ncbi:MAG: heme o synthase [Ilumatobacteraceae bacterium]
MTGIISPCAAMVFAVSLEVLAVAVLWSTSNLLAALLALSGTLFYVFVYTLWLKRTSTQNIVIGGAAGAVPALVGWAAVTNSLAWEPVILFAIIFLWTPPHFWALAIRYAEDYRAADVPMLPSVVPTDVAARKMVVYTVAMIATSFLILPVSELGWIYGITAALSGAMFLIGSIQLLRAPTAAGAMRLFGFSITYVTLLFGAVMVDVLVRHGW